MSLSETARSALAKLMPEPSTKLQDEILLKQQLREWNERGITETRYTPDLHILRSRNYWNFFNYDLWVDPNQQCIGYTDKKFCVWEQDFGSGGNGLVPLEPVAGDGESCALPPWIDVNAHRGTYRAACSARLRGVVLKLPWKDYLELDKELENTVVFHRKRVKILVPETRIIRTDYINKPGAFRLEMGTRTLDAWMYVGNPLHFNNPKTGIDAGRLFSPAKLTRPEKFWIEDFYSV